MKILHVLGVAGACLGFGIGLGCKAPAETAVRAGDVTEARAPAESGAGANWLLNGRTFDEAHFSPLMQITDKNVNGLGLAWYLEIPGAMGVVAEPIVVRESAGGGGGGGKRCGGGGARRFGGGGGATGKKGGERHRFYPPPKRNK